MVIAPHSETCVSKLARWGLAIFCIFASLFTAPAIAAESKPETKPNTEPVFTADSISVELGDARRIILLGNVRFDVGTQHIEATGLVYNQTDGEIYVDGPILILDAKLNSRVYCDEFIYNINTRSGVAKSARLVIKRKRVGSGWGRIERGEVYTLIFETEKLERMGDVYKCKDAFMTSCGFAKPHWKLEVDNVQIYPKRELILEGVRLRMADIPVLGFGAMGLDISPGARYTQIDIRGGNTKAWGEYLRWRMEFPLSHHSEDLKPLWGFTAGYRRKRGGELGGHFEWNSPTIKGALGVDLFSEHITPAQDDLARATKRRAAVADKHALGIKPSTQLSANYLATARGEPVLNLANAEANLNLDDFSHINELRSKVSFAHEATLAGWSLSSSISYESDRDLRSEYDEKALKTGQQGRSFLNLSRDFDVAALSLHAESSLNNFDTATSYLPELRMSGAAFDIGAGASAIVDARVGLLEKTYDEKYGLAGISAIDQKAWRANLQAIIARPMKFAGLQISPYAGALGSWVENSLTSTDDVNTAAGIWGVGFSKRLYGFFDEGENPLRHKVEMRLSYEHIDSPSHDPTDLIGFDELDDLMGKERLRLELLQNWQTKSRSANDVSRVKTVAGLALRMEHYLDDTEAALINSGNYFGPIEAAGHFSPNPNLRFLASFNWDIKGDSMRSSELGLMFGDDPAKMTEPDEVYWRASLMHILSRETTAHSSGLVASLHLIPVGRWSLALRGGYELNERSWTDTHLMLLRDFHDWDFVVSIWHDPQDDDSGVSISLSPKGYPINLPTTSR